MSPTAQRFGEWASDSGTFSAINDHIAVVQRVVHRLFVLISWSLPACPTSPCQHGENVDDYSYVLAIEESPSNVEMAHPVPLRYGGETASVSGYVCDGTGTLYRLSSVT